MLFDALHPTLAIGSRRLSQGLRSRWQGVLEPEAGFLLHGLRLHIVLQALSPLLEAAAGWQRLQRLPLLQALIGTTQLLEQDAPGDRVDHQVMTDQQQAPGLLSRQAEEHGTRQR